MTEESLSKLPFPRQLVNLVRGIKCGYTVPRYPSCKRIKGHGGRCRAFPDNKFLDFYKGLIEKEYQTRIR